MLSPSLALAWGGRGQWRTSWPPVFRGSCQLPELFLTRVCLVVITCDLCFLPSLSGETRPSAGWRCHKVLPDWLYTEILFQHRTLHPDRQRCEEGSLAFGRKLFRHHLLEGDFHLNRGGAGGCQVHSVKLFQSWLCVFKIAIQTRFLNLQDTIYWYHGHKFCPL